MLRDPTGACALPGLTSDSCSESIFVERQGGVIGTDSPAPAPERARNPDRG